MSYFVCFAYSVRTPKRSVANENVKPASIPSTPKSGRKSRLKEFNLCAGEDGVEVCEEQYTSIRPHR